MNTGIGKCLGSSVHSASPSKKLSTHPSLYPSIYLLAIHCFKLNGFCIHMHVCVCVFTLCVYVCVCVCVCIHRCGCLLLSDSAVSVLTD